MNACASAVRVRIRRLRRGRPRASAGSSDRRARGSAHRRLGRAAAPRSRTPFRSPGRPGEGAEHQPQRQEHQSHQGGPCSSKSDTEEHPCGACARSRSVSVKRLRRLSARPQAIRTQAGVIARDGVSLGVGLSALPVLTRIATNDSLTKARKGRDG